MRAIQFIVAMALLQLTPVAADELLIFKRVGDDLGVAQLPWRTTVWHVDALEIVSTPIEAAASAIDDQEQAFLFAKQRLATYTDQQLMALFLMSYSAREKMHAYGLSATPSAVLLGDEGQVLKSWAHITRATDLLPGAAK